MLQNAALVAVSICSSETEVLWVFELSFCGSRAGD